MSEPPQADPIQEQIKRHFEEAFDRFGPTPQGVDWNSEQAQVVRFDQLLQVCDLSRPFSLNDYGCGYGALAGYLAARGLDFRYTGYDLSEKLVAQAQQLYAGAGNLAFTTDEAALPTADYTLANGIFNKRFDFDEHAWTAHILHTLGRLDALSTGGFAFNLLTRYSDPEKMRPDLYYGDPGFFFDYCMLNYSRNVTLLHDYGLFDFTVIVRKV